MNALLPLFAAATPDKAANILAAARALVPHLNRSRRLDRMLVSSRLEDAPAEIVALLANLSALGLTHSRRSEEQVALDQFSTPPELGALAVLAAQVRPGDQVLEPSAGTGLLAVLAEACGATLTLNELSGDRSGILAGLFASATRSAHDAQHLRDILQCAGGFHAVVANPPFQKLTAHLHAALDCLADGGRLAAIVPTRLFEDDVALKALQGRGRLVLRLAFPARAYAKHGTSTETGLLVVDRGEASADVAPLIAAETLADAARAAAAAPARPSAQPRQFRAVNAVAVLAPRARALAAPSDRLGFIASTAAVAYATKDWTGEGHDVGLYQAYAPSRIAFDTPRPHPSPLVESGPMASVPLPVPTYRPVLPVKVAEGAFVSEAQMETVIYAGEAHANLLPGWWVLGEAAHQLQLVGEGHPGAFQVRRGFFLGDGTGAGKGRQIAGVVADNLAQGRAKAVWLSKNDPLLEDARRDWAAIGGKPSDISPQSAWKQAEGIRMDRGILFSTYATLRQPARGDRPSRLDQIVDWLGADFDGVIVFDEAHAMANAAGGGKGSRGTKKASLQGMAGLALQNRLPNARVLYVSATGATTAENLAYAGRLGLWGGPEAPFPTRDAFMEAVDVGGVAFLELVARELKAMGLFIARQLSFEGVEYAPLRHELTPEDVAIWDAWADAYQLIHQNLRAALEATGLTEDGKARSGLAASAAMSAFEGAKLKFFGHMLCGLKCPSLVAAIRQDLAEGRSAVVQVVSTNEAVMERRLAEIPPEEWQNLSVDLSPKDSVLDYLMGSFPVAAMQAIENDDGSVTMIPLVVDGIPVQSQEALRLRDELVSHLACLPAVPGVLDAVMDAFGPDQVAEITGRSRRVVLRGGRRVVERRGASAARAETDAFMSEKKRVLIFSDAGGTGRSYHADLALKNQQRRIHYLVEPGFRADAAIQGLGRSHRTNQASAPLFRPVTTDIHGEKRFLSTIARRLDSLGALTRGERRTAGAGLFRAEDNLESPWAHRALQAFYVALHYGNIAAMSRETFEAKTGLRLLDSEGSLKTSDDMPPMNTFLNRLLALRIADQNALFADFDRILGSILERAAASGQLDRGVEDLGAEDLTVGEDEVLRRDAVTGAETSLIHFQVRTRRLLTKADDVLRGHDPNAHAFAINRKTGRAALVVRGLTTTNDDDRLIEAVRLIRPEKRSLVALTAFEESAWDPATEAAWRQAWAREVLEADPWIRRDLVMVTGLLLPIWGKLPRCCAVRRLKAPDGRRWLGRVIDPTEIAPLKIALGLSDTAELVCDGETAIRLVIKDGKSIALAGGLWLRRARVMDRHRLEVVGPADRPSLTAMGCYVEIISYTGRVFAPVDRPDVVSAILAKWPAQEIVSAAA